MVAALHRSDTLRHPATRQTQRVTPQTNGGSGESTDGGCRASWVPVVVTVHRCGGCVVRSPSVPRMDGAPLSAVERRRARATGTHRMQQRGRRRGGSTKRSGAHPSRVRGWQGDDSVIDKE